MKNFAFASLILLTACAKISPSKVSSESKADREFAQLAEDYITGYLAWRPQSGTSLGFHEFDGKLSDLSKSSLDAELGRVKQFDAKLAAIDRQGLSAQNSYDLRILQTAIRSERFKFEEMESYTRNPMTYADVLDVSIYIKRNFAPLEERVKSIIAIEKQAPKVMAVARANLSESLPQPFVETAIEMAKGAADFLAKDLIEGLKELKDRSLRTEFNEANQSAISEIR